ncbi:hypothetical protein LTS17_001841 [Exophiala oligosperma]
MDIALISEKNAYPNVLRREISGVDRGFWVQITDYTDAPMETESQSPMPMETETSSPADNLDDAFFSRPNNHQFKALMGNGPSSSNGKMASYLRLSSEDPFQNRNGCMQLVEDGHCRYFGATSNLHLLPSGSLLNFQPGSSKLRAQQVEVLSRANLTWNGDHSYEQHLTHLFFAWHNSFIHAIDEAVYRHHQDQYANGMATQLYSPALANAILAMGSLYSTRRCDKLPRLSGPEFFSRRAKALLDLEMDSPTIATLQALLTLSSFELSQARDSRGSSINVYETSDSLFEDDEYVGSLYNKEKQRRHPKLGPIASLCTKAQAILDFL